MASSVRFPRYERKPMPDSKCWNSTNKTVLEIIDRGLCGVIDNKWRGRRVLLYPGETTDMLYMIGKPLDGSAEVFITHERIGLDEKAALDYWEHGEKVLVRE